MQRPSVSFNSPTVYSGVKVHEQTAHLANIGVTDDDNRSHPEDDDEYDYEYEEVDGISSSPSIPIKGQKNYDPPKTSTSPLIVSKQKKYVDDLETGLPTPAGMPVSSSVSSLPPVKKPSLLHQYLIKPIQFTPAVFLGTLLNILDGLSYGMIMFPVSEAVFSSLAPAGLSMFYMSCIVSQLVYSLGGSAFKSGIGSEMIEVTPFFHSMALSIVSEMSGADQDAIIATTITTYAVSSIVTGMVFFMLGKCKLGALVGFFPRHILVGCIGGVGYFLVATGIEVSSRLEGGLEYNYETFKYLFYNHITVLEWTMPLVLTVLLIGLQHKYHNSLLVPLFFIAVFIAFHLIVLIVPSWNLNMARQYGWVFPAVEGNQPWYGFYSLYKFNVVDWWCILKQLPSMLALTFFGILHVPINVPALAVTVGMDQFDVDRELVAHGYSNALSGLVGSIQNYLVYTNSVLFIRAGADDRLAGVLLAIATACVMFAGPVVIGYIPVCVVGSLIYLLGYELLKEAIYDTYGRLRKIEYTTVIIIVVTMGAFDFVVGILVGILLACLSFVVEAARSPVVQGIYSGNVARSTVLRHPKQQEFLKNVGKQICIIKLQGTVFFGSIGGVEKSIRLKFEDEIFKMNPIKFLIIDMKGVSSIDFSAAEGFRRILNLTNEFNTQLIISSVFEEDDIIKGLRDAGLWDGRSDDNSIKLFNTLNYALEWCENAFLKTYKTVKKKQNKISVPFDGTSALMNQRSNTPGSDNVKQLMNQNFDFGTPRTTHVYQAAKRTVFDEQTLQSKYYTLSDDSFKKQPLPLIMITFQGLSEKDEEFWSQLTSYLVKEKIPEDYEFYNSSRDAPSFFIVESGLVRSVFKFESDNRTLHSSILPMTAFGDLYDTGPNFREMNYTTVTDSVIWKLPHNKVNELLKHPNGEHILAELLKIQTKLIRERFDTMTANLVIAG
ncbi:sulfate transporter Sulfate/bicarbonate/oxalate exchanger SAT-1 and related transporter [Suhomyces tanzawaensis NRRL Y-17324]|uniref:Sulfate transporter Sulfate/bicarbonate/oxalate exchanger SAT-1 and related transporter n=1 Tax=Suhomyces tanzawaensis NRRL Y-17324 TaxID=984487 RepID=A0A1E4SK54_9ASCO|nr:sulfate transporter Sulfate/bicarbonate/oxalate exchanger SAT-1 and related transporter [Suhomyces tanzawaensis NRRL Y-17324]ODV79889.1 sulfate transporter Sulfate/bicarbonate/oxalate exchanger SAT-1 and related transporter [Suhomyces tanzawaensis NRRL Y-17324]